MVGPTWGSLRLFLHLLGATVWVGGQLTVAGLVPGLRALGAEAPRAVAARFARLAWPAYVLLVGTGIWNIVAERPSHQSAAWRATLWAKIGIVVLSGAAAWWHGRARDRRTLAVGGALTGVLALAALFFGVLLAG